jgi:hypothetical protein
MTDRFYSSYGDSVDLDGVKGAWLVQGPQERSMLPSLASDIFRDPDVVEVAVRKRSGAGFKIVRDEGGIGVTPNE